MDEISESIVDSLRRRLAVQTATTRVLAETASLTEAVPLLLAELGHGLDWDVGGFWAPDAAGTMLERSFVWHSEDAGARDFVARDKDRTFPRGQGLPGSIWERREARVIEDLAEEQNFPRRRLAAQCNLRSAFAFPVQVQDEFFGVLEFFSASPQTADADLLEVMAAVGIQLGQFVRRTRSEAARLESESRFRIFAESASDATFTIDAHSTILYVNPAAERIFGYTVAELVGRPLSTIMPERMRADHHRGIARYLSTGKRNISWHGVELPGLHKDGHEVPLEISFGEYRRDGNRYFTGIARDITERLQHRREVEQYAERMTKLVRELEIRSHEAEAASQAKSHFLATMSHEIRTPINAIIGYGELLQMGVAGILTSQQSGYLERMRASAKHLLSLITDILDLSKIEAGHFTLHNEAGYIAADVEAALSLVRPQASTKSVELINECGHGQDAYLGDVARVRQILANLLSNAVKFTPGGGTVRVSCGRTADPPPTAHLPEGGPWVWLQVADTGIGITPDDLAAIFRPFVQASTGTTRTHGGTGLGLSISLQLARLMSGDIVATSKVNAGSTFTLWLPTVAQSVSLDMAPADGARGLALRQIGLHLISDAKKITALCVARIAKDAAIRQAARMETLEIADHLSTLLTDCGQALTIMGEAGDDFGLLRDSSDIQRLIAERHGAQRARYQWTEDAVRREFVILREVLEDYMKDQSRRGVDSQTALDMVAGFLGNVEHISIQNFRDTLTETSGD